MGIHRKRRSRKARITGPRRDFPVGVRRTRKALRTITATSALELWVETLLEAFTFFLRPQGARWRVGLKQSEHVWMRRGIYSRAGAMGQACTAFKCTNGFSGKIDSSGGVHYPRRESSCD